MRNNTIGFAAPIAVALMVTFWAITPVTIAYVKTDFSLPFQIWVRYVVSCVSLWALIFARKDLRSSLATSGLVRLLPPGLLAAACTLSFQLFYTYCFFLLQPAFGILLYQSQAVFSLVLGSLFFRSERRYLRSPRALIGMLFSFAGAAAVIAFARSGLSVSLNVGILMAVLAAVSWSFVGMTYRRWLSLSLPPLVVGTIVFTFVAIFLTPFALLSFSFPRGMPGADKWAVLAGSGLLGIAGGQGLYYFLLPRIGLIPAALVQLLVPFATAVFSFFLFGELLSAVQIAGGAVLLLGCGLVVSSRTVRGSAAS